MIQKSAFDRVKACIKTLPDGMVNAATMRASLTETGMPGALAEIQREMEKSLPPKPHLPNGVPQDYAEALFTPGICAIPLWNGSKWKFGAICDGAPIKDGRTGQMVTFDDYEEGMKLLGAWHKHFKSARAA